MTRILRIADIQTSDVLYFDPRFREKCYEFCKKRNIDFLPSLDDTTQIYVRDDGQADFHMRTVDAAQIIDGFRRAFDPAILEVFRANPLLFVCTQGEFSGVVHYSDFNKSVVSAYLFEVLFQYERMLRVFLQECRLTNADMVELFRAKASAAKAEKRRNFYQGKVDDYTTRAFEIADYPPFQTFYLDDLISLANMQGLSLDPSVIVVRNDVMHAHDLVDKDSGITDGHIFRFNGFEAFFRRAVALHHDLAMVRNRVAFMQGLDEVVIFE